MLALTLLACVALASAQSAWYAQSYGDELLNECKVNTDNDAELCGAGYTCTQIYEDLHQQWPLPRACCSRNTDKSPRLGYGEAKEHCVNHRDCCSGWCELTDFPKGHQHGFCKEPPKTWESIPPGEECTKSGGAPCRLKHYCGRAREDLNAFKPRFVCIPEFTNEYRDACNSPSDCYSNVCKEHTSQEGRFPADKPGTTSCGLFEITEAPSESPSQSPSVPPTRSPTVPPTRNPTRSPSAMPSSSPTFAPLTPNQQCERLESDAGGFGTGRYRSGTFNSVAGQEACVFFAPPYVGCHELCDDLTDTVSGRTFHSVGFNLNFEEELHDKCLDDAFINLLVSSMSITLLEVEFNADFQDGSGVVSTFDAGTNAFCPYGCHLQTASQEIVKCAQSRPEWASNNGGPGDGSPPPSLEDDFGGKKLEPGASIVNICGCNVPSP